MIIAEVEADKPARKASGSESTPPTAVPANSLGLVVSDLSEAQKKDLKIKGGVNIDAVEGASARVGLRANDVIIQMGNAEVMNVKEFNAALAKVGKGKPVTLLVRRGELAQYVVIRPIR